MIETPDLTRRSLALGALAATLSGGAVRPAWAAGPSVITVAEPFEPAGLDPTVNSVTVVNSITQNVLETLYAFDAEWKPAPLLAAALPTLSADGLAVTIKLRQGVPFHSGGTMSSADVVASLYRWMKLSQRGTIAAGAIASVTAPAPDQVEITLKRPFLSLMPLLAVVATPAVILPAALAEKAKDRPLAGAPEIIGTGPYRLTEHKPDQYIRLTKFEQYAPSPDPTSAYAGARKAMVDELRIVPVPNAQTRLQGLGSGLYDVAMSLSPEAYNRVKSNPAMRPVLVSPGAWTTFVMNTKQGLTTNIHLRRAIQAALDADAIMLTAYGYPELIKVDPSIFPPGTPYHTESGKESFNVKNRDLAKTLLKQANYNGEPFRIITSQQYDYIYKAALVAVENMQDLGINVDLQLMDWASVMSRRFDPTIWEGFMTTQTYVPDPTLILILSKSYPGWWDSETKQKALAEFDGATTEEQRKTAWAALQKLMYEEAPTVWLGRSDDLQARRKDVQGVSALPVTPLWTAFK